MGHARYLLTASLVLPLAFASPSQSSRGTHRASGIAVADGETNVQSTPEELRFVELTNRERTARHLRQLTIDPLLVAVARRHSQEMMDRNYFDHQSPTPGYRTPLDRYLKGLGHRPDYACVGENLFYCSVGDVERGHQAFMHSPAHRENVLYPQFEKMGVGIQRNAKGEFWVTEMFLGSGSGK